MSASVHEIKIKSTGFLGAPGWSTFYYDGDDAAEHDNQFRQVLDFVNNIKGFMPPAWSGQVVATGRTLDTDTGEMIGLTTVPDDGTGDAVAGSNFDTNWGPGPAGLCLAWSTAGVNRTRRVRGRTFVVPLARDVFESDGTLKAAYFTGIDAAFLGVVTTGAELGIWSRPRAGAGGAWFPVTGAHVVDQAAVLRSRR